MKNISFILGIFLFGACASETSIPFSDHEYSSCNLSEKSFQSLDVHQKLEAIKSLYTHQCYRQLIPLADKVRNESHDKVISVTAEALELFTPEGSLTPYIMESYERAFLAVLIANSYFHLGRTEDMLVELRKVSDEQQALVYNYGSDPIINLLLATTWDRFDPGAARPFWLRLSHLSSSEYPELQQFAADRIKQIDQDGKPVTWHVEGLGHLPKVKWNHQSNGESFYNITDAGSYPPACLNNQVLRVPTQSWTKKLSTRYDSSYHPWLYTKSFVRLPVGLGYGFLTATSGVAIAVVGCGIATKARSNGGELCLKSLKVGGYLIQGAGDITEYTLAPDLRHWENMPNAIVVAAEDNSAVTDSKCWTPSSLASLNSNSGFVLE